MVQKVTTVVLAGLLMGSCSGSDGPAAGTVFGTSRRPPNIILIYADDLGFGDVSSYGARALHTPHIDRLAGEGLRFTNAHAPSATCTPSRYALLTGEYAWRREGTGIAPGDASLIIDPARATLASTLKEAGYVTGVVGKWHLGLGGREGPDWNGDLRPGPLELGFDEAFLIPATGDRVPTVFVENHRVVGLDPRDPITVSFDGPVGDEPTGREHPELLRMHPSHGHDMTIVNGISRIGYMSGGRAARWVDEDIADTLTARALRFIERHRNTPFFLYFSTHDIHVPRVPHGRFAGTSGLGARGDVILQLDWAVGEIVRAVERHHIEENTLILFTSDNGPVLDDGYRDQAVELRGDHEPSGPFRGGKYSAFEAGTRVPFIVRWPGVVPRGTSAAPISQVDLLATFAAVAGVGVDPDDGPDSHNLLPDLLGRGAIPAAASEESTAAPIGGPDTLLVRQAGGDVPSRDHLIEHNAAGTLSIVRGEWKYIEPSSAAAYNHLVDIELGNAPEPQLYRIGEDLGEARNVAADFPDVVERLSGLLEAYRRAAATRPDARDAPR